MSRRWRFDADAGSIVSLDDETNELRELAIVGEDAETAEVLKMAAADDLLVALECQRALSDVDASIDETHELLKCRGWDSDSAKESGVEFVQRITVAAINKATGRS